MCLLTCLEPGRKGQAGIKESTLQMLKGHQRVQGTRPKLSILFLLASLKRSRWRMIVLSVSAEEPAQSASHLEDRSTVGLWPVLIPEAFRSESSRGQVERGAFTQTHSPISGKKEEKRVQKLPGSLFCHTLLSWEMTLLSIILPDVSDQKP